MIQPHASPSATASTHPNPTLHGTGESVVPFGGGSYEIRLAGRLSDPVQDQAALHGLVDRILSHGLEVVEARRLPVTSDELEGEPEPPR
jgi:hypothetical protein